MSTQWLVTITAEAEVVKHVCEPNCTLDHSDRES